MRGHRNVLATCVALVGSALLVACTSSRSSTPASITTASIQALERPYRFATRHLALVDPSRAAGVKGSAGYTAFRSLPTDLYLPVAKGPRPLVVFAHGYHGAPSKFTQLFSAWATAGYIVAAPRFPLTSNRGVPFDQPGDHVNQPADMSFVLDRLLASQYGRAVDRNRIGVAGLSLGGGTVYGLVYNHCCTDRRFKAAAIFDSFRFPFPQPFGVNKVPVLIMHIDSDLALSYDKAKESYLASASPKYFVTLFGGIHAEPYENSPSRHDATVMTVSVDYWDLTLLGDRGARARMLRDATASGDAKIVAG
jgi:dienelactone hydrolase